MPKVHISRNPFRPQLGQQAVAVRAGTRIDTVLRSNALIRGRGKSMTRCAVFVVQVNGEYLLQDAWVRRVRADDVVNVVLLPGKGGGSNPLQAVLMVALVAAAVWTGGAVAAAYGATAGAIAQAGVMVAGGLLINAMLPPPKALSTTQREQASPTYAIGAQGNRARLLEAVPCWYGRFRVYPDFAAEPYSETEGNEQYVYQLFCLTQGRLAIEQIRIEDNDIDSFSEVRYEVIPPGGKVTLFPDNVITSAAVASLEMKGPNEDGRGPVGPYVSGPAGTVVNKLAFDIAWQQGLFRVDSSSKLRNVTVSWRIEARTIDNTGNPTGGWFVLGEESFTAATQTPQIRTYRFDVPEARYQVRVERLSTKHQGTTYANAMHWVGLRAYVPSQGTYGDVTLLAVAIKATNNINQQTQRRVNVIGTRMLRVWDPVGGWSDTEVATRNPAWAAADVVANGAYGRGLPDSRQNLFELHRLAQVWDARGDRFDGVFDTTVTMWEALSRILRVGRAMPIYYAGVIDYVRNEPKSIRKAMFSPQNIVADTFSVEYKFPNFDDPDHVIVEIVNEDTWQPDEVMCVLPGSPALRPYRVQMPGVTSRAQGFREGMSMAASNRDQRRFIALQTEMEGHISKYGDLVQVSHDVPAWGLPGFIVDYDEQTRTLFTSEPLQWFEGENHYVALRRRDGSADGPYRVLPGPDDRSMVLVSAANLYISTGDSEESTHYQFGPGERRGLAALVIAATPDEQGLVTLQLTNYAESVHVAENGGVVPPPDPASLLPLTPNAPIVNEVTVFAAPEPGFQIASATPARGATSYEFQASADSGATWIALGNPVQPSVRIQLPEGQWRVRARGIGVMPGPWKTWAGLVTASMAPPPTLQALAATSLLFGIRLDWILPDAPWLASTELMYSQEDNFSTAVPLGGFAVPLQTYTMMGLRAGQEFFFWARLRDVAGSPGPWFPVSGGIRGQASNDASLILDYIKGQIEETQLGDAFLGRIGKIEIDYSTLLAEVGNNDAAITDLINADKGVIDKLDRETRDRVAQYQAILSDLNKVVSDIAASNAAIQAEAAARIAAVKGVADGLAAEVQARALAVQGVVNTALDQAVRIAAVADAVVAEVAARKTAVEGLAGSIDAQLGALQNDLASLLGTDEFDPDKLYSANALATYGGKLYRALQDTQGNLPTSGVYWDELGDFSSIVDLVSDLASRMVRIEDLTAEQARVLTVLQTLAGSTASSVTQLQQTSATQAQVLTELETRTDGQSASISGLQQTSAEQASVLQSLRTDVNGQSASITGLQNTTAGLASRTTTLEASSAQTGQAVEQAAAQLSTLQEVSAQVAMQLQQLSAEMGNADAELVRIDSVQAGQAIVIERLRVTDAALTSMIETVQTVLAGQASLLTTLSTQQGAQGSSITELLQTTLAQAQSLSGLSTRMGNAESAVTTLTETSATQASLISTLRTDVNGQGGSITTLQQTGQAHAQRLTRLETSSTEGSAAIEKLEEVQGTHASQLSALTSASGTHANQISNLQEVDAEQARQFTQLKSTVDGQGSTISQLSTASATQAQQISGLATRADGIEASVSAVTQTAAGLATRLDTVQAKGEGTATKVETLEQADLQKAMRLQQLEAELGNYDASLTDLYTVSADQARSLLVLRVAGDGYQSSISELRDVSAQQAGRLVVVETATTKLTTDLAGASAGLLAVVNRTTSLEETSAAYASRFSSVESLAGNNKTAVTSLQQSTASMATQIGTLQATDGTQTANINSLQQVEAHVAMLLQQIQAEMGNADASFTELFEVSAGLGRQQTLLRSSTEGNAAAIRTLAETVTTGDSANASLITALTARVSTVEGAATANTAAISSEQTARANADTALTQRIDTAFSNIGTTNAAITSEANTRASADTALSGRIDTVSASAQGAQTSADEAKASAVTLAGLIQAEQTARANADEAFAQLVSSVQASVGENRVSIQDVTTAQAALNGQLSAQRTIKLEVLQDGRMVMAGIGLGIESVGGVLQSQLLFEAGRFAFFNRINGVTTLPFLIEGGQMIANDALIARLDAAKISFGEMHGDRIQVGTLWADRIHTGSLVATLANIQDAYIVRAQIHWAAVDYLRIAGQSATVGATYEFSGGVYVDKDWGNWTRVGVGGISLPDNGAVVAHVNCWHDIGSLNAGWTGQYEFGLIHWPSGSFRAFLPSASIARTYGENSGVASTVIIPGLGPGFHEVEIVCRDRRRGNTGGAASALNYGLEPWASESWVRNPDNLSRPLGIFSTNARCRFTLLSHIR